MTEQQHRFALKPGYKLHWYEIRSVLGKGGFGITYLAHDLNLDRPVAIKEYLPTEFAIRESDHTVHPLSDKTADHYAWGLDRFIKEARTLSKFEHPNIVRVHAVFEENNTGYMVMAYEEGQSLKEILKERKTLDEDTLFNIILPILDGLKRVHEQGFIHRDIKPDNIYVRSDGSPVLLDFGSARQATAGSSQTMTSLVSPGYAPFEQYYAKGEEQGPWTDIYGLGATLYRSITGHKPMDAVYRSRSMLDTDQEQFQTATQLGAQTYSQGFLAAVDHAIQFRPGDRPQTIDAWLQELQNKQFSLAAADTIAARPQEVATQIQPDKSKPVIGAAPIPQITHPANKEKKTPLILGGLVALIIAATLSFFMLKPAPQSVPEETAPAIAQESTASDIQTTKPEDARIQSADENPLIMQRQAAQQESEQAAIITAKKVAEEKAAEQARLRKLADERRLKEEAERIAEAKRIAEQKRIADAKRKEAERLAAQQRQQIIENKIAHSQTEIARRSAKKDDSFAYNDLREAKSLTSKADKKIIDVPASTPKWLSSGVQIEKGNTYRINAIGNWKVGGLCNTTNATGEGAYSLACWDMGGQTVAGYSHGALIGKIGKDTLAFYIGPEFTFTAGNEGTLYFMSNDAATFISDNSGDLNVTIQLIKE
ncbi:MAG: protein kinase [Pseudomonadales bacterium]|nr:protein kinase [Pseudomonadales bacterium]